MTYPRTMHTVVETEPRHYAVLDNTGDTITTFDTLDPGEFTPEQRYSVVVAQIFRKIAAGEL